MQIIEIVSIKTAQVIWGHLFEVGDHSFFIVLTLHIHPRLSDHLELGSQQP